MKPVSIIPALLCLIVLFNAASAQTSTSLDEKTYTEKLIPVQRENRTFNIEVSYALKEMTAGQHVKFTVTITAPPSGPNFLELKNLLVTSRDSADKFEFKSNGMEDIAGVVQIRKYHYIVSISPNTEARRHEVQVGFGYPGESEQKTALRHFDLYVGTTTNGKLEPVPLAEGTQPPSFETGFFKGNKHTYQLTLRNSFPDYEVTVESIKIQSDPSDWIEPKEFSYPDGIPIPHSSEITIPLEFETKPLGIRKLLKGLGTAPKIQADIVYTDGNERRITNFKPRLPISIPPTTKVLLGSIFLGLLIGALVRGVLEFMLFKKKITRWGVFKVVSYSILFGLVLVVLAAVGQIEIKAPRFQMSSSYDNPLTMLVIGLIGALAGVQMIIAWYKSFKAD